MRCAVALGGRSQCFEAGHLPGGARPPLGAARTVAVQRSSRITRARRGRARLAVAFRSTTLLTALGTIASCAVTVISSAGEQWKTSQSAASTGSEMRSGRCVTSRQVCAADKVMPRSARCGGQIGGVVHGVAGHQLRQPPFPRDLCGRAGPNCI